MHFRRIIYAALLAIAGSPLASAAKNGDPPPTKTSTSTTTSRSTKTNTGNNNAKLIGSLWRVSREFGILGCVPQVLPLVTALPSIPPELLGADLVKQALAQTTLSLDEVCDYRVTGTAGEAFTSFMPAWYEWYDAHAGQEIRRLVEKCPKVGSLTRTAEAYRTCAQVVEVMSAAAEASAAATGRAKVEGVEGKGHGKDEL
ncbi:hypothetical protein PG996_013849 [Apiospora saccharicola]|uniref:Uncharacterized protein n=1 Tax=Apiospora saccharicola TaxID=335842 RepID=A0ABR1TIL5_9PEZI